MYNYTLVAVNRGYTYAKTRTTYSALFNNYGEAVDAMARGYSLTNNEHLNLYLTGHSKAKSRVPTQICLFKCTTELPNDMAAALVNEGYYELQGKDKERFKMYAKRR